MRLWVRYRTEVPDGETIPEGAIGCRYPDLPDSYITGPKWWTTISTRLKSEEEIALIEMDDPTPDELLRIQAIGRSWPTQPTSDVAPSKPRRRIIRNTLTGDRVREEEVSDAEMREYRKRERERERLRTR